MELYIFFCPGPVQRICYDSSGCLVRGNCSLPPAHVPCSSLTDMHFPRDVQCPAVRRFAAALTIVKLRKVRWCRVHTAAKSESPVLDLPTTERLSSLSSVVSVVTLPSCMHAPLGRLSLLTLGKRCTTLCMSLTCRNASILGRHITCT